MLNNDLETINHRDHIYLNYQVAKKTFASWIKSGITPFEILNALRKLQVVGINLDQEDDPQVITIVMTENLIISVMISTF